MTHDAKPDMKKLEESAWQAASVMQLCPERRKGSTRHESRSAMPISWDFSSCTITRLGEVMNAWEDGTELAAWIPRRW